jgi:site-specific recombinase XerD
MKPRQGRRQKKGKTVLEQRSEQLKYLTQEQVGALFKAASKRGARDRLLLAFAYRFGMRTAELIELPVKAVDSARGEITIQGMKNGLRRTYSIPRDLKALVRTWERQRDESVPQFFTGQRGRLHRIRVYLIFKECARAAGLPSDIGMHSLRHSAAVHGLDSGLTTDDLRDLLRHRRVSSTEVYATLSTKRRSNYLKTLEDSDDIVKIK